MAEQLQADPQLEWSSAIVGLCKAVEAEIIWRIVRPLADLTSRENLSSDKNDRDPGRVAAFCADPARKPPELGAFAHFLQTVIHITLIANWRKSCWLLEPNGLHNALTFLTTDFRNRAAHIDVGDVLSASVGGMRFGAA